MNVREVSTIFRTPRVLKNYSSFTPYFNLASILLIVSILSLTFQYCVNLVTTIISLMEIAGVTNGKKKKKFSSVDIAINYQVWCLPLIEFGVSVSILLAMFVCAD